MENILMQLGIMTVAMAIIYLIKKIDDYYDDKKTGSELSDKVYRAARVFAEGGTELKVRSILINSIDFDSEDIDKILELAIQHRTDSDGGYRAFLDSVYQVLDN